MNRSATILQTIIVAIIAVLVFVLGWIPTPWDMVASGIIDLFAFSVLLMRTARTVEKAPQAERFTDQQTSPLFEAAQTYKFPILLGTFLLTLFFLFSKMEIFTQLLTIGVVLGYFEIAFMLKSTQDS